MRALTTSTLTVAAVAVSLLYAIVRYNILQDVAWSHVLLYIMNKAVSLTAVIMLAAAYLARPGRDDSRSADGGLSHTRAAMVGFVLAGVHVVLSLIVLQPASRGRPS